MIKHNMDVKVVFKWKNICKGSWQHAETFILDWHKAKKAVFKGVTTNL